MRTSEVVTLRLDDDDSSDNDVEILEQRIKSRKTASLTRLVTSECRYVPTSSSWILMRRNEKNRNQLNTYKYQHGLENTFFHYRFTLVGIWGPAVSPIWTGSSQHPTWTWSSSNCVPLSVCSLTPSSPPLFQTQQWQSLYEQLLVPAQICLYVPLHACVLIPR